MPRNGEPNPNGNATKEKKKKGEKKNYKGAAGVEPATSGSAILRSTAELCTRMQCNGPAALTGCSVPGSEKKKREVLPGLEPGSKDSKSLVMTITL